MKFYSDTTLPSNADYAKRACLSVNAFNQMEAQFLKMIDYDLFISDDEWDKYVEGLEMLI